MYGLSGTSDKQFNIKRLQSDKKVATLLSALSVEQLVVHKEKYSAKLADNFLIICL
jgi:hypothetical protein